MFNTISSVMPINEQLLGRVFLKITYFCVLLINAGSQQNIFAPKRRGGGGEGKQTVCIFLVDFFLRGGERTCTRFQ